MAVAPRGEDLFADNLDWSRGIARSALRPPSGLRPGGLEPGRGCGLVAGHGALRCRWVDFRQFPFRAVKGACHMQVRRRAWKNLCTRRSTRASSLVSRPMRMDGSKLPAGQTPQWADMRARLRSISRIDDGRAPTRLRQLINNSPHREREVVERHYFDNMPMRRVAGRLRVWLSMAYRLRGLAIEQLRQLRGAGSAAVG